jgi:hypothetical protein
MNTNFPEDIFSPQESVKPIYYYRLDRGLKILKNKSVLFCGICKDVERAISLNIERICNIGSFAKKYHIFIYENDSTDNTKNILNAIKSDNITCKTETVGNGNYRDNIINGKDPWHFNRCKILSECRNKYIEYANLHKDEYDYICIVDWDLLGGWSLEGFFHGVFSLEQINNAACVSSYGVLTEPTNTMSLEQVEPSRYLMYDSFAYRPEYIDRGIHMSRLPIFNKLYFTRGQDPIVVRSNFGGMALYKINTIIGKKYYAKQWEEGFVDPDHVNINNEIIKDGYKIILDPNMISSYSKHKYCKDI